MGDLKSNTLNIISLLIPSLSDMIFILPFFVFISTVLFSVSISLMPNFPPNIFTFSLASILSLESSSSLKIPCSFFPIIYILSLFDVICIFTGCTWSKIIPLLSPYKTISPVVVILGSFVAYRVPII